MIYVPENPIEDVWMIVFEFTPFLAGKPFFLFYDLIIEVCCEGTCYLKIVKLIFKNQT